MPEINATNRREFIVSSAGTALAAGVASTLTGVHTAAADGKAETLRLALIGCGGRGARWWELSSVIRVASRSVGSAT